MSACPYEQEALELVQAGRVPDPEHLAGCTICRELVSVASTIGADFREAVRAAHVPSSGLVFWRIQRRAREEAMQTASRAVTVVQAISVAVGLVIAVGIAGAMSAATNTQGWLERLSHFVPSGFWSAATIAQWSFPLVLALAACLALAPVALYLAVARD